MPRRAPGEGYPFKRERTLSNGTVRVDYGVRLSLGYDGNGRRARKVVYGATMREAREKAEVLKVNAARGIAPVAVDELDPEWVHEMANCTLDCYRSQPYFTVMGYLDVGCYAEEGQNGQQSG